MQALNYLVHYKNYSVDNSHKTDQNAQCCLASEDCLKFSIIHLVKNYSFLALEWILPLPPAWLVKVVGKGIHK